MSGRVICGLCERRMSIDSNGQGQRQYRCRHRGKGCAVPSRSNHGLVRAASLGMSLLCDEEIREAIRRRLGSDAETARQGRRRSMPSADARLQELHQQRSMLLQLYYGKNISEDQFGEEQARLTIEIDNVEADINNAVAATVQDQDLAGRFEDVISLLDRLDIETLWEHATEVERRQLLDELLAGVIVHRDRLQVQVHGAPALNVTFSEVGLKEPDSGFRCVGGGT